MALVSGCATQPALLSRVETVKAPPEVIGRPCLDVAQLPALPKFAAVDPERARSAQLAAADEIYIDDLERYARKSDAIMRGCTQQPEEKKP